MATSKLMSRIAALNSLNGSQRSTCQHPKHLINAARVTFYIYICIVSFFVIMYISLNKIRVVEVNANKIYCHVYRHFASYRNHNDYVEIRLEKQGELLTISSRVPVDLKLCYNDFGTTSLQNFHDTVVKNTLLIDI